MNKEKHKINGKIYSVKRILFEDKGKRDREGYYNYYYKGESLEINDGKSTFKARKYDDEDCVYFGRELQDLSEEIITDLKALVEKLYGVKEIRFMDSHKGYVSAE